MTDVNCTTENRGMFRKDTVVDPTSHKEFHGISDTLTRFSLLCHQEQFG